MRILHNWFKNILLINWKQYDCDNNTVKCIILDALNFGTCCKTIFFRRILISRFSYVENLLHFNLADFPVNFIKRFVSCFLCLYQILLSKFLSYYCLHYVLPRTLHIISRKCRYSMQINLWWWAIPKIHVYLISRLYWNHENLMLAKYTCLTVGLKIVFTATQWSASRCFCAV